MNRNAVKFCVASLLLAVLAGCGGGGGAAAGGSTSTASTTAISGVAQGPVVGGTVTIQGVNPSSLAVIAASAPVSTTTSALGIFAASAVPGSDVDLTATGKYFDEVSAASTGTLTLSSYASSSDTAWNVNILTTLAHQRTQTLVNSCGMSFLAARQQAEQEVLDAFYIRDQTPPVASTYPFGTLDLSLGRGEDKMLAAISSIFEYGGINNSTGLVSNLIASFQSEIAAMSCTATANANTLYSGTFMDSATANSLKNNAILLSPATVASNLTTEYKSVGTLFSAIDISDWLDQDGDHVIGKFKYKAVQAAADTITPYIFTSYTVGASDNGAQYSLSSTSANPPTCSGVPTTAVATGNSITLTCTPTVLHESSSTYLQSTLSGTSTPFNIARYDFTPFATVASLATARTDATVTLLTNTKNHNGQVLVAGGLAGTAATATVELYDPVANTWTPVKSMNVARVGHTATMLNNGLVLVVGGDAIGKAGTSELYDPDLGTWTKIASPLATGHIYHTATLLQDGYVLVVGGITYTTAAAPATGTTTGPASVELYNPASSTWSTTFGSGATALALVPASATPFSTAAGTTTFTGTVSATLPIGYRYHHTATLLQNGMVLIWGGFNGQVAIADAELFDPGDIAIDTSGTPAWAQVIPTSGTLAAIYSHTATLSTDGTTVLIAGGITPNATGTLAATGQLALYNSASAANTLTTPSTLTNARSNHIAQPVVDSQGNLNYVLIAGGVNSSALTSAELCDFTGACNTNGNLTYARSHFGAVTLNSGPSSGMVLLVGGQGVNPAETFQ